NAPGAFSQLVDLRNAFIEQAAGTEHTAMRLHRLPDLVGDVLDTLPLVPRVECRDACSGRLSGIRRQRAIFLRLVVLPDDVIARGSSEDDKVEQRVRAEPIG